MCSMKKIIFTLMIVLLMLPIVSAVSDLVITDIELSQEPIAGIPSTYKVHVTNIGDASITSRFAIRLWTNTESVDLRGFWFNLVGITDSVNVLNDGVSRREVPVDGEVFLEGSPAPIVTKVITLNPGEEAVFESTGLQVTHTIYFYPEVRSLEPSRGTIEAVIDPHGEVNESDEDNNHFTKEVLVMGGIVQGPFDGEGDIPSLREGEYFVAGQGCALINERTICAGDETVDDVDRVVLNVDDEERVIDRYNPLYRWIIRLLANGRESPVVEVGDVSIALYTKGFKVIF